MFTFPHWWRGSNSEKNPIWHLHVIRVCFLLGASQTSEPCLPFPGPGTRASLSLHNCWCVCVCGVGGIEEGVRRKLFLFEKFSLLLNITGTQKLFSTSGQQGLNERKLRVDSNQPSEMVVYQWRNYSPRAMSAESIKYQAVWPQVSEVRRASDIKGINAAAAK